METKVALYDVAILDMQGKIVSIIGTNLSQESAEKRERTGLTRINTDAFFVDSLPARKYKVGDYKKEENQEA